MAKAKKERQKIDIQPDSFVASEIADCIERVENVIAMGRRENNQYSSEHLTHPIRLELFVCLDDLLQKASNAANGDLRVRFSDDMQITEGDVEDVTDLINKARNTAAHISSKSKYLTDTVIFTNVAVGKVNLMYLDGLLLTSDYVDDIAIFYGKYRLYVFRHIIRAFEEVKAKLLPLIERPN